MDRFTRAKHFAAIAHATQIYNEEVPYTVHLEQVASVLMRFGVEDEDLLVASYLHDILEDTRVSYSDLKAKFGENVAELVYAVTNERGRNREERNKKTYPKIRYAGDDAITLKLADRIANVEYGMATGGKVGMYRKEFSSFYDALYDGTDPTLTLQRMWAHLSALLGERR